MPEAATTSSVRWARTAGWAAQVARAWSIYVAVMGVFWAAGGAGYPFGDGDPQGFDSGSVLTGMDASVGGPVLAAVGHVGLGLVSALERDPRTAGRRGALIAAGWAYAGALVAVCLDGRALMLLPPLGLFPVKWADADWPTVFQTVVPVAAGAFAVATVAMARRTADRSPAGLRRAAARSRAWDRVGRVATYVAMVCPLPYAIIRVCWSRGWAVGAPAPFVEHILRTQPANVWIEPVLAGFALTGVVLTSGLLARWGRVLPAWVPLVGGRRVPVWFPLVLGGSVVVGMWSWSRGMLLGRLGVELPRRLSEIQAWGTSVDGGEYWGADGLAWVLFPLWAVSLAVALVGYYHRRRLLDDGGPDGRPAGSRHPAGGGGRRRRTVVAAVVAGSLATVSALALPALPVETWRESFSPRLLEPSGTAAVGLRRAIVATGADDPWRPGHDRVVMVDVRYPATAGEHPLRHYLRAEHMTEQGALTWAPSRERELGLREHEVNWQFVTHSYGWAPPRAGNAPAVVISAPSGALRTSLTALAEDLASHGFVVVTVDHPYDTPVVELWPTRQVVEAGDAGRELTDREAASVRADDRAAVADRIDELDDAVAGLVSPDCVLVVSGELQDRAAVITDAPMVEAQVAARFPRVAPALGPVGSLREAERTFRDRAAGFRDTVTTLLADEPGCA